MQRQTGQYLIQSLGGERYQAYIPAPLPPEPPLHLEEGKLAGSLDRANRALGTLNGMAEWSPNIGLFLYQYIRKEALLSSQIEGTQSSFADLLLYEMAEIPGVPMDDTEEVSNYIAALNHGLQRLREGFPLSLRLLCEIHAILLRGGRGASKQPGEFRRSQNWIGGTRPGNAMFVPPPADRLMECLDAFEKFIHTDTRLPVLIKAALLHVQFETIHPFLDGNGRLGRLLITLLLCEQKILQQPLLYLSLYFKQQRSEYYRQLQQVRVTGDWESWVQFFLAGVLATADSAVQTARRLQTLWENDQQRIATLGRIATSCAALHRLLQEKGITNIVQASQTLAINRTTVSHCLARLQELGIVREITAQRRNRLFVYDEYVKILSDGAEPL